MEILTALEKLYDRFGTEYRKDDVVFSEGETDTHMYFVLTGAVEVIKGDTGAQPVVLARVGVGDFFGEMSLLLSEPRSATVRAAEDGTRTIRISPGNFDTIVRLQPQIAVQMLRVLAQRLRVTSSRIQNGG